MRDIQLKDAKAALSRIVDDALRGEGFAFTRRRRKEAAVAGRLRDAARGAGQNPGFADIVIAATANARGLTVLTDNVERFSSIANSLANPFDKLPPLPGA